ncbi:MAG: hypothetical protein ABJA20_00715 [Novosphingobium sp.]
MIERGRSPWLQGARLAVLLGLLPSLSGCAAVAIPVIAAGAMAKSRADAHKQDQPQPAASPAAQPPAQPARAERTVGAPVPVPLPERIPVFAGEGSTRASLLPGGRPDPVVGRMAISLDTPSANPGLITAPQPEAPAPVVAPAAVPAAYVAPQPDAPLPMAPAPARFVPPAQEAPPPVAAAPEPVHEPYSGTGEGTLLIPPPTRGDPVVAPAPLPRLAPQVAALPTPPPALVPLPAPRPMSSPSAGAVFRPMDSTPSSGYLGFTAFAISHANAPDASAVAGVIDLKSPLAAPHLAQCGGQAPAVVIDLDPGLSVFNPAAAEPQPGLGEALAALRSAGVTVMWASAMPVERAEDVHVALARTGLDPARIDRLLLLNGPGDRKQARRAAAARNWCVIAMAGDRRGDFDEVFDYLRDPDARIPADDLFGKGWYIAPPPLP